jgi:outer membrane protein OmpA-like peptidoglycan-associated protein
MKAFGAGPYAPVASNSVEAGRAKNRRVELVEQ